MQVDVLGLVRCPLLARGAVVSERASVLPPCTSLLEHTGNGSGSVFSLTPSSALFFFFIVSGELQVSLHDYFLHGISGVICLYQLALDRRFPGVLGFGSAVSFCPRLTWWWPPHT